MLRSISFKVAWDGNEQFSHFINAGGEISVVDIETDIAKVCVMANAVNEVTDEQREAVLKVAYFATRNNPLVCITFGQGLSPFHGHTPPDLIAIGARIDCESPNDLGAV
jgi:hypothetical protein